MKKLLIPITMCLMSLGCLAQEHSSEEITTLVVNTMDGNAYRISIPYQNPSLNFWNGHLKVSYIPLNGEMGEIQFRRTEVKNVSFEKYSWSDVRPIPSHQSSVHFKLVRSGLIDVCGLKSGNRVQVASVSGHSVMDFKAESDGDVRVDLANQPRGMYIVSVDKRFTFKIMKP